MTEKPQLFGTDGIRGRAGEYPLDRRTLFHLGAAIANVLARHRTGKPPRLLLGRDTRESSPWIAGTVAAGLESAGACVINAGILTTPAVAFLVREHGWDAGVVVSASHNPYTDNGVKVLASSGIKLSEDWEIEIEEELMRAGQLSVPTAEPDGDYDHHPASRLAEELKGEYLRWLARLAPGTAALRRFRCVVDCANGAASELAPKLLEQLGIEAHILHASPDGRNINQACGSVHPEEMARRTAREGADLGVAFDGDADRAIFAGRNGQVLNGDFVLYVSALERKRRDALPHNLVVGTLMTNLAVELALAQHGITLRRAAVGDKYVLEEMLRSGAELGGEPSGHIIFASLARGGDGFVTFLEVLRLVTESGKPLEELAAGLHLFPQIIRNVRVAEKPPLESLEELHRAIADCRRQIGARGRVVVRYSGTEPFARVMVEAEDANLVEHHAGCIAQAIEASLGVQRTGREQN